MCNNILQNRIGLFDGSINTNCLSWKNKIGRIEKINRKMFLLLVALVCSQLLVCKQFISVPAFDQHTQAFSIIRTKFTF